VNERDLEILEKIREGLEEQAIASLEKALQQSVKDILLAEYQREVEIMQKEGKRALKFYGVVDEFCREFLSPQGTIDMSMFFRLREATAAYGAGGEYEI